MPVTAKRTHTNLAVMTEYVTLTFTGTYTTGGVALNPLTVVAGPGSSPFPSGTVSFFLVSSPAGYTYVLVGTGVNAKVKIFNGTTELTNAAAFPDATVTAKIEFVRFSS